MPAPILTVGAPRTDIVGFSGFNAYTALVIPGSLYKISITGLSDDADLRVFGADSTFSLPVRCAVDNTRLPGASPEDCVIAATAGVLYFGVDGTFIVSSSAIYTVDIEPLTSINLNPAVPFTDIVPRTDAGVYVVPAAAGINYTVSLTGLNDDADLFVFEQAGSVFIPANCAPANSRIGGTAPEDCTLTSGGGNLFIVADGIFSTAPTTVFTVLATPAPAVASPSNEGSIAGPVLLGLDTPDRGQVGFAGESFYAVTGLATGRYTVSLTGLSGDADLAVFGSDNTFTTRAACLIDNTRFVGLNAEDCTVALAGGTLYFSVTAHTGSGGVAFISLVEPGP